MTSYSSITVSLPASSLASFSHWWVLYALSLLLLLAGLYACISSSLYVKLLRRMVQSSPVPEAGTSPSHLQELLTKHSLLPNYWKLSVVTGALLIGILAVGWMYSGPQQSVQEFGDEFDPSKWVYVEDRIDSLMFTAMVKDPDTGQWHEFLVNSCPSHVPSPEIVRGTVLKLMKYIERPGCMDFAPHNMGYILWRDHGKPIHWTDAGQTAAWQGTLRPN